MPNIRKTDRALSANLIPVGLEHKVKSRTVFNSSTLSKTSTNWRADYYKFSNLSYAQVLSKPKVNSNQRVNYVSHVKVCSNSCNSKAKAKNSKTQSTFTVPRDTKVDTKQSAPTSQVKQQVKVSYSRDNSQIVCKNMYDVLPVDAVVSDSPATSQDTIGYADSKPGSNIGKSKHIYPTAGASKDSHHSQKQVHVLDHHKGLACSKYDLPLRIKDKSISYKRVLPDCPTLQLWEAQNKFKFGFIPLGSQLMPSLVNPIHSDDDPITLHAKILESNKYNFLQSQINLKSQLNPDAWDHHLQGYWDRQLPFLIRFGFPLDYNRDSSLRSQETNHPSAVEFPEDIKAYLAEEMQHDAILGPYDSKPIEDLHISPMMTRDKPNAPHRRVIIDLSFPQGQSINAGIPKDQYLGTPFVLKLPTVDTITDQVRALGKGCKLYKVDISRAFRHVKLDPFEYDLLGLRHERYYVDTCLPFGYRNGSALFQRLSDAVRHIMRQQKYDVINYIDDILGIDLPSRIDASFDALCKLLPELGFQISRKKLEPPTTLLNCLGIMINTETFTMSIPPQKLKEITDMCSKWSNKKYCSKRQLQSLLGSLLYISKCVKASRFYLNRLLDVLRSIEDRQMVPVTPEAQRDINWFLKFIPLYNGVTFFDQKPIDHCIELDASLQGMGARWGSQVYALQIPLGYMDMQIVHLEMLNILAALRVWHKSWHNSKVAIACDNLAVVQVLNSGKTRDLTLAAIARNIQFQVATANINLKVIHIPGKVNVIADLLSRWCSRPMANATLHQLLPVHSWMNVDKSHILIDWSI